MTSNREQLDRMVVMCREISDLEEQPPLKCGVTMKRRTRHRKASLYAARRAFTLQGEPLRVRRAIEPSHTHMISYRHGGGEWWVMADGGE